MTLQIYLSIEPNKYPTLNEKNSTEPKKKKKKSNQTQSFWFKLTTI